MTSLRCGFRQTASDDVEAVSLHWGFRVDSRSGRYRQEGYTLRSRSTFRDLLTGAKRPFE